MINAASYHEHISAQYRSGSDIVLTLPNVSCVVHYQPQISFAFTNLVLKI